MNSRSNVRCVECGSVERTRIIKMTLDRLALPGFGDRVLHFAPEKGLSDYFKSRHLALYDAVDFSPKQYPHAPTRQFDLIKDSGSLESDSYDLIVHSHVLEHVPITLGHIFFHLNRALKPSGHHIFCIPILGGHYDEYFGELPEKESIRRFGQIDHVRKFGRQDIDRHLGAFFKLKKEYSMYDNFTKENLDNCNIPEPERKGLNGSTVFVFRKHDFLLQN